MDADQRTGAGPLAVRVTRVVSPLLSAVTSSALSRPAPATPMTSTETSALPSLPKRGPGRVLALPVFS